MKISAIPRKILQKYGVKAMYLFGSQAFGKTHRKSDTDIAVRFSRAVSLKDLLKFSHILSPYFQTEVDIVDLENATLPLQFRIFRERRLLYAEDPRQEATARAAALTKYFDYKYYYDRFTNFEIERIVHYGLVL